MLIFHFRFPNDGCTSDLDTYGVCYSASECASRGGTSSGDQNLILWISSPSWLAWLPNRSSGLGHLSVCTWCSQAAVLDFSVTCFLFYDFCCCQAPVPAVSEFVAPSRWTLLLTRDRNVNEKERSQSHFNPNLFQGSCGGSTSVNNTYFARSDLCD